MSHRGPRAAGLALVLCWLSASAASPAPAIPSAPSVLSTLTAPPPVSDSGGGGPAQPFPTLSAGDFERSLNVTGRTRTYILHVPPIDAQTDAVPLLVVLHGEGSNARAMMSTTKWNGKADNDTFVVAYPNSSDTPQAWDASDVAFISQIIDDVLHKYLVDPKRIYVTGFAGGGQMAYRLAAALPERINAIAPVDAALVDPPPAPSRPIAVLAINSSNDPQTPYAQAAQSVAFWAQANGCAAAPRREPNGADTRDIYTGCRAGASVVFYTLSGNAHTWPATLASEPALDVLWSFFTRRTP